MQVKQTKLWKFFSSIKLAICLLSIIALVSIIGTFILQDKAPDEYIARYGHSLYHIFSTFGLTNVYSSWWFILLLILLSLNLIFCLVSRWSLKFRSLGTLISHLSILVVLIGALIGRIYGQKGFIKIQEGEAVSSFGSNGASKHACCLTSLGFSLRLGDFIYTEHTDPEEKLLVYSNEGNLVDEISTQIGKESLIAGTDYRVRILRYLPHFVMDTTTKEATTRSLEPKNPAIEVEFNDGKGTKTFWLFAAYPDIHSKAAEQFAFKYQWRPRRPADFVSKVAVIKDDKEVLKQDIRVNHPLKFGGYTFFQFSYDTQNHNWTGLQVVKDPGVPIVYLGFVLLILGLCIKFYINPLLRK